VGLELEGHVLLMYATKVDTLGLVVDKEARSCHQRILVEAYNVHDCTGAMSIGMLSWIACAVMLAKATTSLSARAPIFVLCVAGGVGHQ
jgi:hypothetical protein